MILADAIWLSIGNLPFLEFWEFFLKLLLIRYSGNFPIDVYSFENKYINMNKTKIKEDILLVLVTLIGLFLFLTIYLTFSTSIYKIFF
jgi:hypothetical protein